MIAFNLYNITKNNKSRKVLRKDYQVLRLLKFLVPIALQSFIDSLMNYLVYIDIFIIDKVMNVTN